MLNEEKIKVMKMKNVDALVENYSYEEIANALVLKGEKDGYKKITDKTKWREPSMAKYLKGHVAFDKISAGKGSEKYGADAHDTYKGIMAEYKSKAVSDEEVRNLVGKVKNKKGDIYAPLTISGIYNGAYGTKTDWKEAYAKHDHYFGVFHKERCVLIIKPHTEYVMSTLIENDNNRKPGSTTNLNTVKVNLADTSLYELSYKDEEWFLDNK
tara:strand:- start:1838 stop:2473 length:636 start_codon:yes stop_codon:yes gene_type:complete